MMTFSQHQKILSVGQHFHKKGIIIIVASISEGRNEIKQQYRERLAVNLHSKEVILSYIIWVNQI